MASAAPAARVEDPFGHSSAMNGVMIGLAVGALIGTAILTGGVSLIAVGAAVAITGGAGMAGQAIGQTIPGPDTGVIAIGSPNVAIDRRPAAMTVLATGPCSKDSGPPVPVATGAKTVRINNQLAARVGETMACSAVIRRGSAGVFIGGPSETVIKPTPEVPVWLENTMLAMAIGGTAIGTLGVGLTYGAGAAVGSLVGASAAAIWEAKAPLRWQHTRAMVPPVRRSPAWRAALSVGPSAAGSASRAESSPSTRLPRAGTGPI